MAPTIRVDDDVYDFLKSNAEPFEDTPNSVLRRLLSIASSAPTLPITRSAGRKTPQSAFRGPILSVLARRGGGDRRMQVLEEVDERMDGTLSDYDRSCIGSGAIRWQKSAEWEVRAMREAGLLKRVGETAAGVWALTDLGLNAAQELSAESQGQG